MLSDGYRLSMLCIQCPHSPGHAVPDVSVYEHRARGLGRGGGD